MSKAKGSSSSSKSAKEKPAAEPVATVATVKRNEAQLTYELSIAPLLKGEIESRELVARLDDLVEKKKNDQKLMAMSVSLRAYFAHIKTDGSDVSSREHALHLAASLIAQLKQDGRRSMAMIKLLCECCEHAGAVAHASLVPMLDELLPADDKFDVNKWLDPMHEVGWVSADSAKPSAAAPSFMALPPSVSSPEWSQTLKHKDRLIACAKEIRDLAGRQHPRAASMPFVDKAAYGLKTNVLEIVEQEEQFKRVRCRQRARD